MNFLYVTSVRCDIVNLLNMSNGVLFRLYRIKRYIIL